MITINNESKTLKEWCIFYNFKESTIWNRIRRGIVEQDLFKKPFGRPFDSTKKFGKLSIIECIGNDENNEKLYKCKCDCGNEVIAKYKLLRFNHTKSCGCIFKNMLILRNKTHGLKYTREYGIWCNIKKRCYNKKSKAYYNYGGRGIKMCDRWLDKFENFFEDMGNCIINNGSIERIANNLGYFKENCRWATMLEQNNNKRNNIKLTYNSKTMTILEWSKLLGISKGLIAGRYHRGWSIDRILNTPKLVNQWQ